MRGRGTAVLMAVLLALYLGLVGWQAVQFLSTGVPVAIAIGIGLIVLLVLGGWALWRELEFGVRSQRLVRILGDEGGGDLGLTMLPSGRIDRMAADEAFDDFARDAEHSPHSWRVWLRLGLAYDAAGDRRRARMAVRRAISLERASR